MTGAASPLQAWPIPPGWWCRSSHLRGCCWRCAPAANSWAGAFSCSQLQSPGFVAALAVLFTVIGLNLAGVFDLRGVLPGNLAAVRVRHPVADHMLTGVLAAPLRRLAPIRSWGVALGTALALPTLQTLSVFAGLGFGMALPYLAISLMPGLARGLPRPGVWMQCFKVLMAFPMFATVVWLLWVLGQQVGTDGAVGLLGVLVALAFMAWALGTPGFGLCAR